MCGPCYGFTWCLLITAWEARVTVHSCIPIIIGIGKAALLSGLERTPVQVCTSAQVGDDLLTWQSTAHGKDTLNAYVRAGLVTHA